MGNNDLVWMACSSFWFIVIANLDISKSFSFAGVGWGELENLEKNISLVCTTTEHGSDMHMSPLKALM